MLLSTIHSQSKKVMGAERGKFPGINPKNLSAAFIWVGSISFGIHCTWAFFKYLPSWQEWIANSQKSLQSQCHSAINTSHQTNLGNRYNIGQRRNSCYLVIFRPKLGQSKKMNGACHIYLEIHKLHYSLHLSSHRTDVVCIRLIYCCNKSSKSDVLKANEAGSEFLMECAKMNLFFVLHIWRDSSMKS